MSSLLQLGYNSYMCVYGKEALCLHAIDMIPPPDAALLTFLVEIRCTYLQEELRYLASLSHAQRKLYEADVKHLVLQQYCRAPMALYESLLAPPLTTHEHHMVREMLLPASRVRLSITCTSCCGVYCHHHYLQ